MPLEQTDALGYADEWLEVNNRVKPTGHVLYEFIDLLPAPDHLMWHVQAISISQRHEQRVEQGRETDQPI